MGFLQLQIESLPDCLMLPASKKFKIPGAAAAIENPINRVKSSTHWGNERPRLFSTSGTT